MTGTRFIGGFYFFREYMITVVVTGGTGLIGSAVVKKLLEQGYQVIVFTRQRSQHQRTDGALSYRYWNVERGEMDQEAVLKADAIIHLAGAGVMEHRWSAAWKQEIVNSRVQSGLLLSETLLKYPNRLNVLISASATGWYGPDPAMSLPAPFTEDQPAATDFLGNCCKEWEQATASLSKRGIRTVYLRTGIVLAAGGGAMAMMQQSLKFRVAAVPGNGRQVISWIHLEDLVNLYLTALNNEVYKGAYNAVAPAPVSNRDLVRALAAQLYGRAFVTVQVPAFLIRLVMGERAGEVLKSTTVSALKVLNNGFEFRYPDIRAAARQLED